MEQKVKFTNGTLEQMLENSLYRVSAGESLNYTCKLYDIGGTYNEKAWSQGKCMPKHTYSVYVERDARTKEVTSVRFTFSNHWEGVYGDVSEREELVNTDRIPIRADIV